MEASHTAAAAGGGLRVPIYISDEDDERNLLDDSCSPEDIEIQEAILLSLNSTRAATSASVSTRRTNAFPALKTPPDLKGKRKLQSEGTLVHSNPEFVLLHSNVVDATQLSRSFA
jgi:E3 ubiquitin-protein ligase RNF144